MIIKIKDAEKNKRINILGVPHGIVFHESSSKCMSTVHHKAFIGDIEKILENYPDSDINIFPCYCSDDLYFEGLSMYDPMTFDKINTYYLRYFLSDTIIKNKNKFKYLLIK
jgi:peroxiredoxin family protein